MCFLFMFFMKYYFSLSVMNFMVVLMVMFFVGFNFKFFLILLFRGGDMFLYNFLIMGMFNVKFVVFVNFLKFNKNGSMYFMLLMFIFFKFFMVLFCSYVLFLLGLEFMINFLVKFVKFLGLFFSVIVNLICFGFSFLMVMYI